MASGNPSLKVVQAQKLFLSESELVETEQTQQVKEKTPPRQYKIAQAQPQGRSTAQAPVPASTGFGIATGPADKGEMPIPHNEEAEEAVLGSLLIDRNVITEIEDWLKPEDFFSEELANLYRTILDLYTEGKPADLKLVRDRLKVSGKLGDEPGQVKSARIFSLMHGTPSPVHVRHYAEIVKDRALCRQMIGDGARITSLGFDEKLKPAERLARMEQIVSKRSSWWEGSSRKEDNLLWKDQSFSLIEDLIEQQTRAQATGQIQKRMKTGLRCLDGEDPDPWSGTGGTPPTVSLKRGSITLIASRPGGGKTTLFGQTGDFCASEGFNVVLAYNELTLEEHTWRQYIRLTGIPFYKFEQKCLDQMDQSQLIAAGAEIDRWPGTFVFIHCPGWSANKLIKRMRRIHERLIRDTGHGIDLAGWDYIQRAGDPEDLGYGASKEERIDANVTRFADFVSEINAAGLLGCQIKKEGYDDTSHRPTLADLKGSGALAERPNQIVGVWRDDDKVELHGLKYTSGQSGWVKKCQLLGKYFKIVD